MLQRNARTRIAWMIVVAVVSLAALNLSATPHPARAEESRETAPKAKQPNLGKLLFFDSTLSNPKGMSCATCHAEAAGFAFPKSNVNLHAGPVPGVVHGRFGNRRPPSIAYAAYLPQGPPQYVESLSAFVGGLFWDGRATDLANQATFPFQNPNEENDFSNEVFDPGMVVAALEKGPNAKLFMQKYGSDIFNHPTSEVFQDISQEIANFETTDEVSPFSSKYDAFIAGKAKLNAHEMNGLMLVTGSTTGRPGGPPHKSAQCVLCHGIPSDPSTGPDLWTNSCFANIGIPRNPNNPFYKEIDSGSNPLGYNALGEDYIDFGLGGSLYPQMGGLPAGNVGPGNNGQGDFLQINGTFKTPTLRNVDKRPSPDFIKCYGHNGVFKSLKEVVHFYNTRNLTTVPGEVIDFTQDNPYANLQGKPLWPVPEYASPDTMQNPSGAPNSAAGQVGNLQLSKEEEGDIVAFLKTLSDGYFRP
ncbi:MAG TPA: cytochrome c peroxidase [Tepidisphaeraceae bacterium]|nr:cytochrome c peroxidase [Tepidisphaeraceae bacterium]